MSRLDSKKLEEIIDDLLFSFPQFFRRVSRDDVHPEMKRIDPSRFVLVVVMNKGPLPISEIGKHMDISKPYMTVLIDKLISEGLVERIPDRDDRRITKIAITKFGRKFLKEFKASARETIKKNLSTLSSKDIATLHKSMEKVRDIISKLDESQTNTNKE